MMSSGQWDSSAIEALEREALEHYAIQAHPLNTSSKLPVIDSSVLYCDDLGDGGNSDRLQKEIYMQQMHSSRDCPLYSQNRHETLPMNINVASLDPSDVELMPPNIAQYHHVRPFERSSKQPMSVLIEDASIADGSMEAINEVLHNHIKHCTCSCNHMGYGNYMDYQTTYLSVLPDVTEPSNHLQKQHVHYLQEHDNQHNEIKHLSSSSKLPYSTFTPMQNTQTACDGGYIIDFIPKRRSLHSPMCRSLSSSSVHGPNVQQMDDQHITGDNYESDGKNRSRQHMCFQYCFQLENVSCLAVVTFTTIVVLLVLGAVCSLAGITDFAGFFSGQERSASSESKELRMLVVRRVLQQTPLIDGHNDLPWLIRRQAYNRLANVSQTDWPRLRDGLVSAQFWSAYIPCAAQNAVQVAFEQIDLIHRFIDINAPRMQLSRSSKHIVETHQRGGSLASLIGVEGGHALGSSLSVLRAMYTLGVRYLTLTYTCDNAWASSAGEGIGDSTAATLPPPAPTPRRGLSAFGRQVVREMNRLGMMIDLTHASDATVRDVLHESRAPVIFSHSAARALCNSSRSLSDETLRMVADNGGIVMISFDAAHVACGDGGRDIAKANSDGPFEGTDTHGVRARMAAVVAHIKHVRTIAGVRHIGIGAGFDEPPNRMRSGRTATGLDDFSAYPQLFAELLLDPNWTEADLADLAGQNMLRVLRSVESVRDYSMTTAVAPVESLAPRKQATARCLNTFL